ncbi:hypothetical protein CRG98_021080 [Punica granatum]|uniref:CCHC-type domain-containing protein n=2 Tax=Punica granatum TaxID=22663 RepID=A0A2I0JQE8_PUNGR|nr:hypothetical protein CRG98_021080 [Punica granatum]
MSANEGLSTIQKKKKVLPYYKPILKWVRNQKLENPEEIWDYLKDMVPASIFERTLRNWWMGLIEQDQLQFLIRSPAVVILILHVHFIGHPDDLREFKRKEFFERKCCSYKRKHLNLHFKHMVRLFYELEADISLKQGFLYSIPASVAGAAKTLLQARGKRVIDCTVGEIQQEIHVALEDASMKKEAIREVLKGDKSMEKACKRPELYIKCSSKDKTCSCPTKKKKHYKKCYICNRPSHYAKNCPRAPKQGVRFVQQLETATGISLEKDDMGSIFSLDKEAGPSSIAALEVLADSDSSFSRSDSDIYYMAAEDTEGGINLVNSVPHVPISVYISKYAKSIKVIAFLDTGAAKTIMNRRVLGSALPRKDIVVGWDVITKQDLIEPSNSPWACEAFYVNKRSEQVKGKLRLIIWPPACIPMEWNYPEDYQRIRPILEQALKEYNEEHQIPPPNSQDPYSPNPEALMQLDNLMQMDLNSPTEDQGQPNSSS